jgi:hypothetical protein
MMWCFGLKFMSDFLRIFIWKGTLSIFGILNRFTRKYCFTLKLINR